MRAWIAILLIGASVCHAQSGVLASSRYVNWDNAGAGTLPARATICSTIAPYGTSGTPASAATINTAIAGCPANEVVYLSAGSFYLNTSIDFKGTSNVTLRGAGADQTKLYFSGSDGCYIGSAGSVCLDPTYTSYIGDTTSTYADWTAGYSAGTTTITLSKTTGLQVGSVLILDQCDDGFSGSGAAGGTTGCATGSATDSGQVWNCSATGTCSAGGPGGAGRTNRAQQQQVVVTGVSGLNVTISPGLYMANWRSGQSPGAFWPGANLPITQDGVENLSIDDKAATGTQESGFLLDFCYKCWITGTRSIYTSRNHIWMIFSSKDTIANNYMFGTVNSTDLSYGIEHYIGSDNLIINNIAQHTVSPEIMNGADEGNVVAYNYSFDDYFSSSAGWFMPSQWQHAAGTGMDLWEGNQGSGWIHDDDHGTGYLTTLLRNYQVGTQASCYGVACTSQTASYNAHFSRYMNVIGNVFGSLYFTNYSSYPTSTTSSGTSQQVTEIIVGYSGNFNTYTSGNGLNDYPLGQQSLMLWGNWDSVNNAVRFNSAEVPSSFNDTSTGSTAASIYENPLPSSGTIQPSFFLSTTAHASCGTGLSFWKVYTNYPTNTISSCPPFPPIGPDVTGGNIAGTGGFANNIPAAIVVNSAVANRTFDSAYQVNYASSAASCSGSTVTLTVATLPEIPQGKVVVSGFTPSGYNGTYDITGGSTTSIQYAVTSCPATETVLGSALYPNILQFNSNVYQADTGGSHLLPGSGGTGFTMSMMKQ